MTLQAVLWDMDGLMIDSEPLWTKAEEADLHRDIAKEKADSAKYADAWKTGGGGVCASAWLRKLVDMQNSKTTHARFFINVPLAVALGLVASRGLIGSGCARVFRPPAWGHWIQEFLPALPKQCDRCP